MFGTQVLDKDGISAGAIISEMATYLNSKGKTVTEHLEELYQRYFLQDLSVYISTILISLFSLIFCMKECLGRDAWRTSSRYSIHGLEGR